MSPPPLPGLPGLPKLPPLPGLGRAGNGPSGLAQALGQHFGGFMQAAPGRMLPGIFPGSQAGGNAIPAAPAHQSNSAAGTAFPGAGLPTIPLPGGMSVGPPAMPFASNAANAAPQASTGLFGTTANVVSTLATAVRSVPSPPGIAQPASGAGTPGGAPTGVSRTSGPSPGLTPGTSLPPGAGNLSGAPPGMANASGVPPGLARGAVVPQGLAHLPGQAAATVTNVVSTAIPGQPFASRAFGQAVPHVASTLVAGAPPLTAATQAPNAPMTVPGQTQALAHSQVSATAALPPSAASPMQAPAAAPPPAAAAQSTSPLAQVASMPVSAQGQPQPMRADTALAAPGNAAVDRAAVSQLAQAPQPPNLAAASQSAAMLAAAPLAAAAAQTPVVQQLAGNPQAQAPGNPVAGTAALDAGGPVRAELTGTGTYTADGPGLRRRERMKVNAHVLGQWMLAAAQGRLHLVRPYDADTPREVAKAFQWLFWVLAIVAYGCLGLVLVSFLLSFGELPSAPVMRRWTGEFALSGLLAAVGAWWLGRQLTRVPRSPPNPIRR